MRTLPFREFDFLANDVARLAALFNRPTLFGAASSHRPAPPILLSETTDGYTLKAQAPGLDPATLAITLTGNTLTIEGEKKARPVGETDNVLRRERTTGKFTRTINVEGPIAEAGVTADYKNGILTVTLPKAEAAKPRTIAVNAISN